jgi:hypothetical protein
VYSSELNERCANPFEEILKDDAFEPLFATKIAFKYFAENAIG